MSGGMLIFLMRKTIRKWFMQYMEMGLRKMKDEKLRRLKITLCILTVHCRKNLRRLGKPTKTFHQSNAEGL
jgi:phosphatidylserine decarboxylase